ncbi:MAG: 4Fe-4S binding protein [Deltaproteobacteria bacterium]|nr:4Fe-4S binding protein [Deltaproteobacteria bacterium]
MNLSLEGLPCSMGGRGDVEEPNGHIFLKPQIDSSFPATVLLPKVMEGQCDGCGVCADICAYNAIAVVRKQVLIFPELCRGCGACSLFCPRKAIVEISQPVGTVEIGAAVGVAFVQGILSIGQIMTPAVIAAVKGAAGDQEIILLDCPPGTSCPVIEAVRDVEAVLLVTEPTPFGLHDLTLAVEMTRALKKPFCVVLNRFDLGDDKTIAYCREENIPIVLSIPDDRRIAEAYARGEALIKALPSYAPVFIDALERLLAWCETHVPKKQIPVPRNHGRTAKS